MILFEPPCTPNNWQIRHGYDLSESVEPSFCRELNPIKRRLVSIDFESAGEATAAYCRGLWHQTSGGILPITFASPSLVEGLFIMGSAPRVSHRYGNWTVQVDFEEVPA